MEKRALRRTPLQVNGKYAFPDDQDITCHRCMLMDVSSAGIGLLMASPHPVGAERQVVVEFPIQCKTARAQIELKWSRLLSENTSYNWAAGGLWTEIAEEDKQMLMNFAAENMAAAHVQAEHLKTIL